MRTNKRVMNVSEAKLTLPKTSTEKIGYIRTVKHFTSLVVNTANSASTCVDVDAMEVKGLEDASTSPSQTTALSWLAQILWLGPNKPTAEDPTCISPYLVLMIPPT